MPLLLKCSIICDDPCALLGTENGISYPVGVHSIQASCFGEICVSRESWRVLRADLVPKEVAEAWLKYLREELPTVAFKCSTQRQATNLSQRRLPAAASADGGFAGSECLGAETLLQLLKNYARASDIKTAISVGGAAC